MRFNGSDYDPEHDNERLSKQHERVRRAMLDGKWRTLEEIAAITGDPPASISAQLRHLRKARFGGYTIDKQSRGDRKDGLYEYRLLEPTTAVVSDPDHDHPLGKMAVAKLRSVWKTASTSDRLAIERVIALTRRKPS